MVGAVAALLALAVGIGAFFVLKDDDDDDDNDNDDIASMTSSTSTSSTTFGDTTSTTVAVATSSTTAATTTTTTRRATTTTTRGSTTTTAAGAPTSTAVSTNVCGSGSASVSFSAKDLVTDALMSSFTPEATVDNQVDKPIEVKQLTLEVSYPNGEKRNVTFTTAGTVINPSTAASFTADKLTTAQRYSSVKFTRFSYFTAGQESSCLVSTP